MLTAVVTKLGLPSEVTFLRPKSLSTLATIHQPYINSLLVSTDLKIAGGMALDKIRPNDSRVKSEYLEFEGHRWHYLDARPKGESKGTVVLVHGFPDISLAWRYQVPMLLDLGMRCIAIDCMGYGETGFSQNLHDYTFKHHADFIAHLAQAIKTPHLILGGHDWGGAVVYRVAQFYPDLISHVFSVATPYFSVQDEYYSVQQLVDSGRLPNFGYQLQFGSDDKVVEKAVSGSGMLEKFLTAMYGGKLSSGRTAMSAEKGVNLEAVRDDEIGMSPLFDKEELEFYISEFSKNTFEGPCNWYRTRKLNWEDDKTIPNHSKRQIKQPTLFIQAKYDSVLIPSMSAGMEKSIPNLTRGEVPSSHWALWHTPQETNEIIKRWFEGVVLGGSSKL